MAIILSENFRALFYAPFYAAVATGAFTAAGVEVVLRPSSDPLSAVRALQNHEVDVMWGGPLRVMMTHDAEPDADVLCFADVVARDPFFIIGARPNHEFRMADLVGIRLATVSEVPTPWLCLAEDLRRAGIAPDRIDQHRSRAMAENVAALRAGAFDAIQVFQPFAETLLASGDGHLWYAAATRGLTAYTTLVTRRDVLQARRTELAGMVRGLHWTLRWFAATPSREIARSLEPYFPAIDGDLFAGAIARYQALGIWNTDPVIRRAGYDWLHAAMRHGGALLRDIPFEACVDTAFASQVIAEGA